MVTLLTVEREHYENLRAEREEAELMDQLDEVAPTPQEGTTA